VTAGMWSATTPTRSGGVIGARTRSAPRFCVTTDVDALDDRAVTVRERDAMTQDRIGIDAVPDYLRYG
jgi:glycyl-tRNA synthetase